MFELQFGIRTIYTININLWIKFIPYLWGYQLFQIFFYKSYPTANYTRLKPYPSTSLIRYKCCLWYTFLFYKISYKIWPHNTLQIQLPNRHILSNWTTHKESLKQIMDKNVLYCQNCTIKSHLASARMDEYYSRWPLKQELNTFITCTVN